MKSILKNLIVILVLGGGLYAAYNLFFAGGDIYLEDTTSSEGEVIAREFLVRLSELERINFSRDLFDDPRFRSLTSFSTFPESTSVGRPNPFSP